MQLKCDLKKDNYRKHGKKERKKEQKKYGKQTLNYVNKNTFMREYYKYL